MGSLKAGARRREPGVGNKSRASRPRKALKGRKKIAQGNALGSTKKRISTRGLDARAKSNSDLGKKMWAVMSDPIISFGLTYDQARTAAKTCTDRGIMAVVMTDVAAHRIHGLNELATQ